MPNEQKHNFINRLLRYGPVLFCIGLITYASTNQFSHDNTSRFIRPVLKWLFSAQPEENIETLHIGIRKLAHFVEYAILAFFACRSLFSSYKPFLKNYWVIWSIAFIITIALIDEFHQSFYDTRVASIIDSLIDIAGGIFSILAFYLYQKKKSKKQIIDV